MSITDRTRKILWRRSGNLCAYCRRVLVEDGTDLSDESVGGDECHMIGEKPGAARGLLGVGRDDKTAIKLFVAAIRGVGSRFATG